MQGQTADQGRYRIHAVALQIIRDPLVDLGTDQWIIKQRGAYSDGRGAGDQKLQGVFGTAYPPLSDDRNPVRSAYLIDLMDLQQRNRLDRRP